jgi:hypothetical protein
MNLSPAINVVATSFFNETGLYNKLKGIIIRPEIMFRLTAFLIVRAFFLVRYMDDALERQGFV